MTATSARREPREYHHGRTPAGWIGSMGALVGFIVGAVGFVMGPNWIVFWVGMAIIVIALIATVVLRKMGLGQD